MKFEEGARTGYVRAVAISVLWLGTLAGCGASQDGGSSAEAAVERSVAGEGGASTATNESGEAVKSAVSLPAASRSTISYFAFSDGGRLNLGTADGLAASVEVTRRKAESFKPAPGHSVISMSPDGQMIAIEASPGRVVGRSGKLLLNMSSIADVESAAFAPDGLGLYVSEPSGKIRVWGQSHSFEKPEGENLENYLNRQASDFNVQFDPLAGPMFAMPEGGLLMGGADGVISFWHSSAPGKSKRVMKLDSPVRSVTASNNDVVTVSQSGALKVGTLEPSTYHLWSKQAKTEWAATNTHLTGKFVEVVDGTVRLREAQSGEVNWTLPLPSGRSCGVAVSPDGRLGAACVADTLFVFNVGPGTWDSVIWLGAEFGWQDPGGRPIR